MAFDPTAADALDCTAEVEDDADTPPSLGSDGVEGDVLGLEELLSLSPELLEESSPEPSSDPSPEELVGSLESSSVAPVAAMRESTSDWVVHVTLVPALFTRGKAAHLWSQKGKGKYQNECR